ncbi:aminoacyl-tRNA hydrolase [Mesorhizobium muleiense]|uniref:aminoacyl-tRNA hydrolase n=1 Tax=Mesorhizobium muleiense TaxID=1004279 RepID=UPI001F22AD49|nr:aminoacyl-tRNA hydrolase [Mesorhizobium muleiense]MCF6110774.1 peptidyl-tRNA hydrolase [Mesorhizobium muleiense]
MNDVVKEQRDKAGTAEAELRMWLFIRQDLPMPPGKLAAQAGHGYATCLWLSNDRDPDLVSMYMSHAQAKIAVGVKNEVELLKCVEACKEGGLVAVAVKDAARTVFDKSTYTVGAVGPCFRKDLPKRVSRLRLFEAWQTQSD